MQFEQAPLKVRYIHKKKKPSLINKICKNGCVS